MKELKTNESPPALAPKNAHCWKTIGVWGNGKERCVHLVEVIHCRNCEVFTQAGRNLLERDLPPEYIANWTEVLACKKDEHLSGSLSLLIFRIEQEWLALPSILFAEVIEHAKIHSLPHRPNPALLGVANVHGEVRLCVNLRALLGIQVQATPAKSQKDQQRLPKRMLVVDKEGERWVFPVDEIHGIQRIYPSQLGNTPVTVSKSGAGFSKGLFHWEHKQVALLDDDLLFYKLTRSVQ
jgi:chemotaxis-related protein WspD